MTPAPSESGGLDHPPLANAKVLITGGAGLIGSALARRLVSSGADVRLLDNFDPHGGGNLANLDGIREAAATTIGDVRDAETIREALRGCDLVFNLAAQTSHMGS